MATYTPPRTPGRHRAGAGSPAASPGRGPQGPRHATRPDHAPAGPGDARQAPRPAGPQGSRDPPGQRPAPHQAAHRPRNQARHAGRPAGVQARGPPATARTRPRHPRAPFILLLVGLLGGALVSLLVISTTLAEGSYRITSLQQQNANLAKQEQLLTQQVAQASSPAQIAQEAEQFGMRPNPAAAVHQPQDRKGRQGEGFQGRRGDQRPRIHPVRTPRGASPGGRPPGTPRARGAVSARADDPPGTPRARGLPGRPVPPGPAASARPPPGGPGHAARSVRPKESRPGPRPGLSTSSRRGPGASSRAGTRAAGSACTLLAIVFVLTLFAARLVQLQGLEAGRYRVLAVQQRDRTIPLPAVRGTITGANGEVLAMTVATYLVYADPPQMPAADQAQVATKLAAYLNLPADQILEPHPAPDLAAVRGAGQGRVGPDR